MRAAVVARVVDQAPHRLLLDALRRLDVLLAVARRSRRHQARIGRSRRSARTQRRHRQLREPVRRPQAIPRMKTFLSPWPPRTPGRSPQLHRPPLTPLCALLTLRSQNSFIRTRGSRARGPRRRCCRWPLNPPRLQADPGVVERAAQHRVAMRRRVQPRLEDLAGAAALAVADRPGSRPRPSCSPRCSRSAARRGRRVAAGRVAEAAVHHVAGLLPGGPLERLDEPTLPGPGVGAGVVDQAAHRLLLLALRRLDVRLPLALRPRRDDAGGARLGGGDRRRAATIGDRAVDAAQPRRRTSS